MRLAVLLFFLAWRLGGHYPVSLTSVYASLTSHSARCLISEFSQPSGGTIEVQRQDLIAHCDIALDQAWSSAEIHIILSASSCPIDFSNPRGTSHLRNINQTALIFVKK